ncbi:hypothetical protein KO498_02905 [Lentibacter algarum]|uniref:hypothetical protein n=1 Tax=Lentibacter algarum TaxID=576131 RepID=UPI001C07E99A|nr:hypothetical protein [Lentibacter algarum]MBU2980755.1 hypothetical protein [Lentibacter algarum]
MTRNFRDRAYIHYMNRRQFTFSLGALTAAPLIPTLASAGAPTAALSSTAARIYPWAAQFTRVNGQASAAKLVQVFRISPQAAAEISAELVSKGVVTPAAGGALQAVKPVNWKALYAGHTSAPVQAVGKLKGKMRDALENSLKEATVSESEPTPEDQSTDSAECPRA